MAHGSLMAAVGRCALVVGSMLVVVAALFVPRTARAQEVAPLRLLVEVEGADSTVTRRELMAAVDPAKEGRVTVADGASFRASLKAQRKSVSALLSGSKAVLVAAVQRAAGTTADAVLLARAERTEGRRKVRVLLVSVRSGAVVLDDDVILPTKTKARGEPNLELTSTLAPGVDALARGTRSREAQEADAVGSSPAPAPAPASSPSPSPASPLSPRDGAPGADVVAASRSGGERGIGDALYVVSAGFELGMRHLDYRDRITDSLRSYEVTGVPLLAAAGEVYPLARVVQGPVADIGITASYRRAVGLGSATSSGATASTAWSDLEMGARYRLRTGGPKHPIVYFSATYGATVFELTSDDPSLAAELPSVDYRVLRAGGDVRLPLGPVALTGGAGYRGVLSAGAVSDRFPNASQAGVDGRLGVAFVLPAGFEARAIATYTRYFYDFSPQPGDRYVAGGALDQLGSAHLGLAYAR